jgi:hypothetical protein
LTGSAVATDPVCSLAPDHALIETARAEALGPAGAELEYRSARSSAPA